MLEAQTSEPISAQQNFNPARAANVQSAGHETPALNVASREEIRGIIQEEIDVLGERLLEAIGNTQILVGGNRAQRQPRQPRMTADDAAKLNGTIGHQINSFVSQGAASQAEMAQLELMIARLPNTERLQALRTLNKAVNSGKFDVKF